MLKELMLRNKSKELRKEILQLVLQNGGHLASSLSCVDILLTLYYGSILKFDARNPKWQNRDIFILSKGHAETALYVILMDLGFFTYDFLQNNYRKGNYFLGGHPDVIIPGVEATSGSLGHGLGIAAGMALSGKFDQTDKFHFVLLGDAECTEGSIWEAALFASKHRLNNLCAIIDYNSISALDFTENFTQLEPFNQKWKSFGWETKQVDGHNIYELMIELKIVRSGKYSKPCAIIAKTIKGKGISFMENEPKWHTQPLTNEDLIKQALLELSQ